MYNNILTDYDIKELIDCYEITGDIPINDSQIQPASLDLRLSNICYKIKTSFLPGEDNVSELLKKFTIEKLDLSQGQILEKGSTYIVPLVERIDFSDDHYAIFNPKSTTGRLDIFARVIGDKVKYFDYIPNGYNGQIYLEISPLSFNILVSSGACLTQMRVQTGTPEVVDINVVREKQNLLEKADISLFSSSGVLFSVDLSDQDIVGYLAKNTDKVIDLNKINHYEISDFWQEIKSDGQGIILQPNNFYILSSKENIYVPVNCSAQMVPYDVGIGEFRVHYAGFFDPGFGCQQESRAVLEVRCREIPFYLTHGQIMGRLIYYKMLNRPNSVYGSEINSNYSGQKLKLAKQFKNN